MTRHHDSSNFKGKKVENAQDFRDSLVMVSHMYLMALDRGNHSVECSGVALDF